MSPQEIKAMSGTIFDESTEITVVELCEICSVDQRTIDALIAEGILEPGPGGNDAKDDSSDTRLPYSSVRVTSTVIRLQRDLGVNLAGAALALDLLQQIEQLRTKLRRR